MDSIRVSEAPDPGSIPGEATNCRGCAERERCHPFSFFLRYRSVSRSRSSLAEAAPNPK